MPVQCLDFEDKQDIYDEMMSEDAPSIAAMAVSYAVSRSTIRRVIDEMADQVVQVSEHEVPLVDDALNNEHVSYTYVMTPDSISITRVTDDDVDTANIDDTHDHFEMVFQMIVSDPRNQDILDQAFHLVSKKHHIESMTRGRITVIPEENRLVCKDGDIERDFNGRLVQRMIEAVSQNDETAINGLFAFTERLAQNPSFRAVNELYDFLEAVDIKINEKGMVECFKKVKSDFTDVYTGTMDNSVGQTVSVPRNMVDEDSDRTCSYGLHVCSYSYLGSYPGDVILKVLVDPADFVAIPKDYYSLNGSNQVKAKARVCKYEVVQDVSSSFDHNYF
jgi:hypothetical protein